MSMTLTGSNERTRLTRYVVFRRSPQHGSSGTEDTTAVGRGRPLLEPNALITQVRGFERGVGAHIAGTEGLRTHSGCNRLRSTPASSTG